MAQAQAVPDDAKPTVRLVLAPHKEAAVGVLFHPHTLAVYRADLTIRARVEGRRKYTHRFSVPLVGFGETCQIQLMSAQVELHQTAPRVVKSCLLRATEDGDGALASSAAYPGAVSMVLQVDRAMDLDALPIDIVLRNTGRRAAYMLVTCEDGRGHAQAESRAELSPSAFVVGPARRRSMTATLKRLNQNQPHANSREGPPLLALLTFYFGPEVARARYRRHLVGQLGQGGGETAGAGTLARDSALPLHRRLPFNSYFAGEERHVDRELPGRVSHQEAEFDEAAFVRGMQCIRLAIVAAPLQATARRPELPDLAAGNKSRPQRVPKPLRLDIPVGNGAGRMAEVARPFQRKSRSHHKLAADSSPARSEATVVLRGG